MNMLLRCDFSNLLIQDIRTSLIKISFSGEAKT